MQDKIEEKLEDLKCWDREKLINEWKRLFEFKPPKSLSRSLMVRAISYRWQEQIYGGLKPEDKKLLEQLADAYERDPSNFKPKLQIKTGTRLRRLYEGKVHEITSLKDGFAYEGKRFGSLSEIARVITGTRWNGHAFFGLKLNRNSKPSHGSIRE